MKKLSIVLSILLFVSTAFAQTWYPANSFTVAWDAVAMPTCPTGTASPPICPTPGGPSVGTMKYQVYLRTDTVSAGTKVGAEVTATQLLVTLAAFGNYYVGVESVVYYSGQTVAQRSPTKAWSNVAADTNNNPFGVSYFPMPVQPGGLRLLP